MKEFAKKNNAAGAGVREEKQHCRQGSSLAKKTTSQCEHFNKQYRLKIGKSDRHTVKKIIYS